MSSPDRDKAAGRVELPSARRTLLQRFALWAQHAKALRGRVEHARGRWAAVDATFETIEHDSQIGGAMLGGALSYRLFVFALPLAFFVVSGLGLLTSAVGFEPEVVTNSVGLAGVVTEQIASATDGDSNWWIALTAFFALVYATRGLLRGVSIVHSLAWQRSAASVKVHLHSLWVFSAALTGQLALVAGVGAIGHQSALGGVIGVVIFVSALAGLWLIIALELPHSDAGWTDLIPGSLLYAIGFTGVLLWNILMLDNLIQEKTSTYGALGTAVTLLLAFFLLGRVIVAAAVLNATLHERRTRSREASPRAPAEPRLRSSSLGAPSAGGANPASDSAGSSRSRSTALIR